MRRDASAYIRANFNLDDRLAVVLIQQEGEEKGRVLQKFWYAGAGGRAEDPGLAAVPQRARVGHLRDREPAQAGRTGAPQERHPGGALAVPGCRPGRRRGPEAD